MLRVVRVARDEVDQASVYQLVDARSSLSAKGSSAGSRRHLNVASELHPASDIIQPALEVAGPLRVSNDRHHARVEQIREDFIRAGDRELGKLDEQISLSIDCVLA